MRLEDVRRLLADRKISIELTDAAKELLFHPGLRRQLRCASAESVRFRTLVQDPLALKILDGDVLHGDHIVVEPDKKPAR